jgi:uncharacterized membrane protein YkoI
MMNNKVIIALTVAGAAIVGLIGIERSSVAQTAIQNPVAVLQQQKQAVEPAGGDGDGETNDDAKENQESTKLQSLAKITPQQAKQAAEAAQGGKASSVKLENENGNVIYSVVIGKAEVTVDAGNGRILSTENSQKGDKESSEQNSLKSSVQSPAGIGDGDGEKNDD